MIVRPRLHWFRMLLVWRGSVLGRILPQLLTMTGVALVVVVVHKQHPTLLPDLTPIPFTLLGIALAIFLGFRNSVSYDRFWEARRLWGAVLNDTRSLARQVVTLTDADADSQRTFVHGLIAFAHALKAQLRGADATPALRGLLPDDVRADVARARFKPALLLRRSGDQLLALRRRGQLEPVLHAAMDRHLGSLTDSLGGCERIASTPIPFAYSVLLHRTAYLYSFMLPLGLVATVGAATPVVVALASYTFFALEALAEELQDPFGIEPNDLPLDSITWMIEATLRETIGEPVLSDEPVAVQHVLR
ncbi:putative membrane protein [Panacagrimonas perspica]|uniref:Putative membrane protein n=1 Tax=Panacagrimonas perspica TaxID=381431 RepID=A0A4S3K4K6_9GAMM|nr:bestrophin family ion channel [Panacagrimonas perspica]TDU31780.1 putative membrane protein [Panacagrimonas perspica]THD03010.1 hypothetical protein B1810_10440 [Panacagrimonas perspica]